MKQKSKILFYMPNLDGGGAERVIVNIIKQLDNSSYDIYLALVSNSGDYINILPSYIKVISLDSSRILFSLFKLRKLIKGLNPDVLFSSLFDTNIILYLASINILKNKQLIMRSPNSPKLVIENKSLSSLKKYLLNLAYKKANIIIAQTPEMKDEIIKYHNINQNKIEVFLNPLDTKLIDESIKNISNPFNNNNINVVAVGRLHRQKGFDVLVKSFKEVIKQNDEYRLHIIGRDKGEEDNLKNLTHSLGLEKYITFHGFQSNPYKYYYYSDLYVLSSRWEGLPNTVLENMYLGKPIITTTCIPFMKTLIKDNENGILVEVGNIEQLTNAILKYKLIIPKVIKKEDNINTFLKKHLLLGDQINE
jgi:glycosyltransferase involved in cell wall biosynthesis